MSPLLGHASKWTHPAHYRTTSLCCSRAMDNCAVTVPWRGDRKPQSAFDLSETLRSRTSESCAAFAALGLLFEPLFHRSLGGAHSSTISVDILKILPTATHHCAVKGRLGFAVETLPTFTLYALRKRFVRRLEATVHVKIFITRCVRVPRIKASTDKKANDDAEEICPGEVPPHDGRDFFVAKVTQPNILEKGYRNLTLSGGVF